MGPLLASVWRSVYCSVLWNSRNHVFWLSLYKYVKCDLGGSWDRTAGLRDIWLLLVWCCINLNMIKLIFFPYHLLNILLHVFISFPPNMSELSTDCIAVHNMAVVCSLIHVIFQCIYIRYSKCCKERPPPPSSLVRDWPVMGDHLLSEGLTCDERPPSHDSCSVWYHLINLQRETASFERLLFGGIYGGLMAGFTVQCWLLLTNR